MRASSRSHRLAIPVAIMLAVGARMIVPPVPVAAQGPSAAPAQASLPLRAERPPPPRPGLPPLLPLTVDPGRTAPVPLPIQR